MDFKEIKEIVKTNESWTSIGSKTGNINFSVFPSEVNSTLSEMKNTMEAGKNYYFSFDGFDYKVIMENIDNSLDKKYIFFMKPIIENKNVPKKLPTKTNTDKIFGISYGNFLLIAIACGIGAIMLFITPAIIQLLLG